ncbi:MAG: hypothetical protein LBS59_08320 [Puniceicoccales bacterium]|jgi:hypothetical protein|nr:hypothetical protein [Puniceicoccales bacterium]
MKTHLRTSLSLVALLAASSLAAQVVGGNATPSTTPPTTVGQPATTAGVTSSEPPAVLEQGGQKFHRICTIKSIPANYEFQSNVQVMQARRDALAELHRRQGQAITTPEKEALKWQIDDVFKQFSADDQQMLKTYGFSVTRNYLIQIVRSRIYTPISDEDYNKLPEAERNKADHIISRPFTQEKDGKPVTTSRRLVHLTTIEGVASNEVLRQDVQQFQALNNRARQLTQLLNQVKAPEEKKRIAEALEKTDADIQKSSEELRKKHKFDFVPLKWTLEIDECSLYTHFTDEELKKAEEATQKKIEEDKKKAAAAPPKP